jgi:hypothetical protein
MSLEPRKVPEKYTRMESWTNEQLLEVLNHGLLKTIECFTEMGYALYYLEERGCDTAEIKKALGTLYQHLLLIASGQVTPEYVVRFGGKPLLFQRVRSLPEKEQAELLGGQTVPVVVVQPNGSMATCQVKAEELNRARTLQVFAEDHIRSPEEQADYIRRQPRSHLENLQRFRHSIGIDRNRGGVVHKGEFLSKATLKDLLEELDRIPGEETTS